MFSLGLAKRGDVQVDCVRALAWKMRENVNVLSPGLRNQLRGSVETSSVSRYVQACESPWCF